MSDGRTNLCYVCGGTVGPRHVGGNDVLACRRCGFAALPAGTATPDYWARKDALDDELAEPYWTTARTSVFHGALDRLAGQVQGRRLLDLGGGVGHFARCALDRGWDAWSVDVSPAASAAAGARIGPERALPAVPDALAGTFDVVTLWCVVAHLADPRRILDEAVHALRPGGRLFLTTPNFRFQSAYARVLAASGRSLDFAAHDHVAHFTPRSLRLLLEQHGFDVRPFTYVGVTEDCLLDRRLASALVPAKRAWNSATVRLSRAGVPLLSSELHVVAIAPAHRRARLPAR